MEKQGTVVIGEKDVRYNDSAASNHVECQDSLPTSLQGTDGMVQHTIWGGGQNLGAKSRWDAR